MHFSYVIHRQGHILLNLLSYTLSRYCDSDRKYRMMQIPSSFWILASSTTLQVELAELKSEIEIRAKGEKF